MNFLSFYGIIHQYFLSLKSCLISFAMELFLTPVLVHPQQIFYVSFLDKIFSFKVLGLSLSTSFTFHSEQVFNE